MKYVISDQGEIATGTRGYHADLAEDFRGNVIAAGYFDITDGRVQVYGQSIGYMIRAQPYDAFTLQEWLDKQKQP